MSAADAVGLTGRRALVTGASGGIGAAIAEELARRGAYVLVHYGSNAEGAQHALDRVRTAGAGGELVQADLRDSSAVSALAEVAGGLDVLVNNAGLSRGGPLAVTTDDDFDTIFDVNVKAPFFLTRALLPRFRDGGAIVNISSMVSMAAYPKTISYSMAKTAVNAFSRSLAVDLGPRRITVNAVAPGLTETPLLERMTPEARAATVAETPLGRAGQPADIARVVAFLASPEGAWVTGQVIQASGGMKL